MYLQNIITLLLFPNTQILFSFFSKYFIENFSFLTQLVEHLPGVEITCTPPELSVKLQGNNDTHAFQWTFNLTFKVSKRCFLWSTSELGEMSSSNAIIDL